MSTRTHIVAPRRFRLGALALIGVYLWGGYSASQNVFPFPELRAFKSRIAQGLKEPPLERPRPAMMAERFTTDALERLVADTSKQSVSCPPQAQRTAVLLLLGQSNAANYGGQRFASDAGVRIINFHAGKCVIAASPLLGATGFNGEYWTLLGNKLVTAGIFDTVVLVPAAFGGTEIAQWVPGGRLDPVLRQTTADLDAAGYRVTHVLWHQGEHDFFFATNQQTYERRLLAMIDTLRSKGIEAPVLVSVATKCGLLRGYSADNAIQKAQRALPGRRADIRAGVDTDALLNDLDRYDDCHFSASGQHKVADAWFDLLRRPVPPPSSVTWTGVTGSIGRRPARDRP